MQAKVENEMVSVQGDGNNVDEDGNRICEFYDEDRVLRHLVINRKWGNFRSSHLLLIEYDNALDIKSLNPCQQAAEILEKEGINAEVINLRSIRPLDRATINASARKTNRLVTVEDGFPQHGVGAEIWCYVSSNLNSLNNYASVVEDSFGYLDAPVERIAGADVPTPYAANLERMQAFPQIEDIVCAAKRACYRSAPTAASAS